MIVSGSGGAGSYFRKVMVPVAAPVLVPSPDVFNTAFQQQKFVRNLAFSMQDAAMFPRRLQCLIFLLWNYILGWIRVQIRFRNQNA